MQADERHHASRHGSEKKCSTSLPCSLFLNVCVAIWSYNWFPPQSTNATVEKTTEKKSWKEREFYLLSNISNSFGKI